MSTPPRQWWFARRANKRASRSDARICAVRGFPLTAHRPHDAGEADSDRLVSIVPDCGPNPRASPFKVDRSQAYVGAAYGAISKAWQEGAKESPVDRDFKALA